MARTGRSRLRDSSLDHHIGIIDTRSGMPRRDQDRQPSPGDVLVTTEAGVHFLSVVPYPHRLSFRELDQATEIAAQWAKANGAVIWRKVDGEIVRLK